MAPRLLLLLMALSATNALAGSPADPEIVDGTGDIEVRPTWGIVNIARPSIDIKQAWFSSNSTTVSASWQIVDLSAHTIPEEEAVFTFTYRDAYDHFGIIDALLSAEGWRFRWTSVQPNNTVEVRVLDGEVLGDTIRADVPRSLIHGPLTRTAAGSILLLPDGRGGSSGGGNVWFRDWAPDYGYGRDFTPT